ncbi:MAG: cardiolipin synthase [Akkermansia sp.]|nr:cardiolipin synthase [Akkermansia sp.]
MIPPFPSMLAHSPEATVAWTTAALALCLAVGCVLAVHSLMHTRSTQGAVAWIICLVTIPVVAVPLYLLFGMRSIDRRTKREMAACGADALQPLMEPFLVEGNAVGRTLWRCCGCAPCSGNAVELLRDGNDTYPELERAIRAARRFVMVEFYIIRSDKVGDKLRDLLMERARAGLDVYVIYDEIGSMKLPQGYLGELRQAGVKVAPFNGHRFWLSSILRVNFRNHRKLVVVDGELAYMGSLNIGLEYWRYKKPRKRNEYWRDTFISLQGPAVCQTMQSFMRDWYRATGENIGPKVQVQPSAAGAQTCQLIPSSPNDGATSHWHMLVQELAAQARERLWLTTPYFVPTEALYSALQGAALRGVDVRILVPQKSDNKMADLARLTFQHGLVSRGVKMLAYTPGVLHEKVTLMDRELCSIGSANMDERSLRLNFELTMLLEGREMNARVAAMLEEDMSRCVELKADACEKSSWPVRVAARVFRLFSPVL